MRGFRKNPRDPVFAVSAVNYFNRSSWASPRLPSFTSWESARMPRDDLLSVPHKLHSLMTPAGGSPTGAVGFFGCQESGSYLASRVLRCIRLAKLNQCVCSRTPRCTYAESDSLGFCSRQRRRSVAFFATHPIGLAGSSRFSLRASVRGSSVLLGSLTPSSTRHDVLTACLLSGGTLITRSSRTGGCSS